jgi:uncharacterized protein with PIN domain
MVAISVGRVGGDTINEIDEITCDADLKDAVADIAYSLLKKANALKPITECPDCNHDLEMVLKKRPNLKFCPYCGQSLEEEA